MVTNTTRAYLHKSVLTSRVHSIGIQQKFLHGWRERIKDEVLA